MPEWTHCRLTEQRRLPSCCSAARVEGSLSWQSANSAARQRCLADGGMLFAAPMYWFYEMNQAALNPSRACCRRDEARCSRTRSIRWRTPRSASRWRRPANCSSARRAATAGRNGTSRPPWSAASACRVHIEAVWERPFCRLLHFERMFEHAAAPAAAAAADRRADVGALRDPAARHRRGVPAQPRRLHHRLGRRPHGAARRRAVRSRRLHRLRHLDAAFPRRRRPRRRGVPAVGAGAGGGRAHGGDRRSLCAALDGADGRPDRHPRQSDRREQARRNSAASIGSGATSSPRCRFPIPA